MQVQGPTAYRSLRVRSTAQYSTVAARFSLHFLRSAARGEPQVRAWMCGQGCRRVVSTVLPWPGSPVTSAAPPPALRGEVRSSVLVDRACLGRWNNAGAPSLEQRVGRQNKYKKNGSAKIDLHRPRLAPWKKPHGAPRPLEELPLAPGKRRRLRLDGV